MTEDTSYDAMMDGLSNDKYKYPLTVEELLKPRYEVIADYPDSIFLNKQILTVLYEGEDGQEIKTDIDGQFIYNFYPQNFPHLFRKLQWWEKRELWQMPEYVEKFGNNAIIKPDKWLFVGSDPRCHTDNTWQTMSAETCIPATQSDYEAYIKAIQP